MDFYLDAFDVFVEHELQELGDIDTFVDGPFDPDRDLKELEKLLVWDLLDKHFDQDFGISEPHCFEITSRPRPWIHVTNLSLERILERDPFYVLIQPNVALYGVQEGHDHKHKWLVHYVSGQSARAMKFGGHNLQIHSKQIQQKEILVSTDGLEVLLNGSS